MSQLPVRAPKRRTPAKRRSAKKRSASAGTHALRRSFAVVTNAFAGLRARLRRVPRAAWVCAAIALLNAVSWSIITPAFQGRDEVDHFAYIEQLAETGTLPHGPGEYSYPPQQALVMQGLHYGEVRFTPSTPSLSTAAQQQELSTDVNAGEPNVGTGQAGGATFEPPLFYALQTIPYKLGAGNILVQLQLMRLLGALFGALTVLLVFLFAREVLPGSPWAATVGAICVALQPAFAFTTGSLNPDSLLFLLSAATFLCLALGFRRRLTPRLAIVLGLVIAAGFVTYYSFIGVALGAFAGLLVLAIRDARARGRRAFLAPAIAVCVGIAPAAIDWLVKTLSSNSHAFGKASSVGGTLSLSSLPKQLSYVWEIYLPRLPGMTQYFKGISTWREIWFDRSVGLYGWMDTMFPGWVDTIALFAAGAVIVLLIRELVASRAAIRARLPELACYAAISLSVLVMIGLASYNSDVVVGEIAYGEPRYLMPMLALFATVIALAVRGAGRRWAPVVGAAMVVLFVGHDLFSQIQVIARYYG